jgi:hypothetical protein
MPTRCRIPGAFLEAGDRGRYWRYYDDVVRRVRLMAAPASERVVAVNAELPRFLAEGSSPETLPLWCFFPAALGGEVQDAVPVDALTTGGRSFLLPPESAASLGLPPCLYLDLDALGWGAGALELRFEVKGAGTLFTRTRVDEQAMEALLAERPGLARAYEAARPPGGGAPEVFSSLAMYESRNMGGQREDYAVHSTRASEAALGTSVIRFVPTFAAVVLPDSYHDAIRFVSRACGPREALYAGRIANEIRCTPSTVRAVYFDRCGSDDMLQQLCRRVSCSVPELDETSACLADDVRRYLEHLAVTTHLGFDPRHIADRRVFSWTQFGDIWVTFERDEDGEYRNADEYRYQRRVAWYLAKDEVIVPRIGRMFVDMECLRSIQVALSDEELEFQHALYILNVMRDHNRVATQFRVGAALVDRGVLRRADRRAMHRQVLADTAARVNESPHVRMTVHERAIEVEVAYCHVPGLRRRYVVPREQMGEVYL